jgi:hypothetical protein
MSKFSQAASDAFYETFPAAYMGLRRSDKQPTIAAAEPKSPYDEQLNQLNIYSRIPK